MIRINPDPNTSSAPWLGGPDRYVDIPLPALEALQKIR